MVKDYLTVPIQVGQGKQKDPADRVFLIPGVATAAPAFLIPRLVVYHASLPPAGVVTSIQNVLYRFLIASNAASGTRNFNSMIGDE